MTLKEKYFRPENFNSKSSEFLEYAKSFFGNRSIDFAPQSSALIVLDMQDYFLSDSSHAYIPSASVIIPPINLLINEYFSQNLLVIFTQNINTSQNSQMMSKWWKDLITEGSQFAEIAKDIEKEKGIVISKSQYDAFYETNLENILKEKLVKQLVITGVMTHLCYETTARSAFVRGYEVFFPVNGTATYNEKFHLASLANLSHGFAVPVVMEDLINKFKNNNER